jgi:hypothetical protein
MGYPVPSEREIDVALVAGQSVVAFSHVEGAAVGLYVLDDHRHHDVRVGIAIAVRVGAEIVRDEIGTDLKEGGDRLTVVAGDSGREILGRLDASGGGFDGQTGDGDGGRRDGLDSRREAPGGPGCAGMGRGFR